MKILLQVLLALLIVPASADELRGRVSFTNGDTLTGLPEKLNDEGDLVLQAGDLLRESTTLPYSKLFDLRLEGKPVPEADAGHLATLHLTNGDLIRGQLTGLDDEHVTLDTWYGGQMRFKRSMSSRLVIERIGKALYVGPDGLANWKLSGEKDAWSLNGRQLSSKKAGSVAREIELPEKCRLGFKLAWRQNLKFHLILFSSDGTTNNPDNCYDLVCQRRFIYLRKSWKDPKSGSGTRTIGQPASIKALADKEEVQMEFFIDRKAGTAALYVEGMQAQVWTDENPEVGALGNWIHFVSEEYPLRISDIRVAAWEGALPENIDVHPWDEDEDEGVEKIRLTNGDELIGELVSLKDGSLLVAKEGAEIKIPIEKVRAIPITGENDLGFEQPRRQNRDIHAWLADGGRITFALKSLEAKALSGSSQTFGEAKFDLSAFSRIDFNIYDADLEMKRSSPDW